MDTKRTIIFSTAAMAVVVLWLLGLKYIERHPEWAKKPEPPAEVVAPTTSTQPSLPAYAGTLPTTGPGSFVSAATMPGAPSNLLKAPGGAVGMAAQLGSAKPLDPNYAMQVEIDPMGAGIRLVTLNEFKHAADFKLPEAKRRPYVYQDSYFTEEIPAAERSSLATRSVTISGPSVTTQTIDLWNVNWTLEPGSAANTALYSVTLNADAGPVLKVTKTFVLPGKADPSLGYELRVIYGFENLSDQPLVVKSTWNGPTLPPREQSRGMDRQVMAGYKTGSKTIEIGQHFIEAFKKDEPTIDLTKKDEHPVEWAGLASTYFAAYVLPLSTSGADLDGGAAAGVISTVSTTAYGTKNDSILPEDRTITLAFNSSEIHLPPKQLNTLPLNVFFGPRWRKVLDTPYYAAFPHLYDTTLVIKTGPCAFCTFDWLIKGMVILLGAFQWLAGGFVGGMARGSWGIAIIMLVVIVRTALHPIMKRSQMQMMKMGQMGPELEKLKKKHGDDKDAYAKAQMQFMKEQGFAPVLGCLPMFLQMPIWIALYSALQTTFELRQAPFLWNLTWIRDLSKPDYLLNFGHPVLIPVLGWVWPNVWHIDGFNLLPLLMAVVFFLQQKFTPKPAVSTPEQAQQQKMMQWMTLLFPVFLYNGPSGLNLYILTSTTIGIVEAKIIRDHMKQQEAAKKAGVVLIDDPPPGRGGPGNRLRDDKTPPTKPGLVARAQDWWTEFQKKVDVERRNRGR